MAQKQRSIELDRVPKPTYEYENLLNGNLTCHLQK